MRVDFNPRAVSMRAKIDDIRFEGRRRKMKVRSFAGVDLVEIRHAGRMGLKLKGEPSGVN